MRSYVSILLLVNILVSPLAGMNKIPRVLRSVVPRFNAQRLVRISYKPTYSSTKIYPTLPKHQVHQTTVPWWRSWWSWLWQTQKPRVTCTAQRLCKPVAALATAAGIYASCTSEPSASVWHARADGNDIGKSAMRDAFVADCVRYASNNAKIPAHTKNNDSVRIATYNVHAWRDPHGVKNFDAIMAAIKATQADIMILQEVTLFNKTAIERALRDAGYTHVIFGNTVTAAHHPCGNMIISKYPFVQKPVIKTFDADAIAGYEKRCYIKADIALPNTKTITLYGTHLDVWDATETRRTAEIEELAENSKAQPGNIMIGADFNAVRTQDYQYYVQGKRVWDLLNINHLKRTGMPVPTTALAHLEGAGFTDSFTRAEMQSPRFTVWSGTAVDFLYLNKQWRLPILGSYVYYSAASDHLPVIVDIGCKK